MHIKTLQNNEASSHSSLKFRKLIRASNMHKLHCFDPVPNYYASKPNTSYFHLKTRLKKLPWTYCGGERSTKKHSVYGKANVLKALFALLVCPDNIPVFTFQHKVTVSAGSGICF